MSEKPIERLNYFNGQRLQAGDFRLEQDYHIRVRRWLNRSLYEPGIAMGLEVHAIPGAPRVRVSPGLAIDALGREIILLEDTEVPITHDVQDKVSGTTSTYAMGPYLVIRYNEQSTSQQDGCCAADSKTGDKAAAGGPARIVAEPVLECVPYPPPDETSNKIVLGLVILAKGCASIDRIDTGVRRYVGDASAAKVKQYAIEGEREVASVLTSDLAQPIRVQGNIRFHIRGRQPNAVTLYLRADEFSPLHYTELGNHTHVLSTVGGSLGSPDVLDTDKEHGSGTDPTPHEHKEFLASYFGNSDNTNNAFLLINARDKKGSIHFPVIGDVDLGALGQGEILSHVSTTAADPYKNDDFPAKIAGATQHVHKHDHTHTFTFQPGASGINDAGVTDLHARTGVSSHALTYVDDLQVAINGQNVTTAIVTQLKNSDPTWFSNSQDKLGNGSSGHPLAAIGTGGIRLDFLPGISFFEAEYLIELSVAGNANGGRIQYNLYVE
jgi:hypothetical protein